MASGLLICPEFHLSGVETARDIPLGRDVAAKNDSNFNDRGDSAPSRGRAQSPMQKSHSRGNIRAMVTAD
jgi:hypothetical protein